MIFVFCFFEIVIGVSMFNVYGGRMILDFLIFILFYMDVILVEWDIFVCVSEFYKGVMLDKVLCDYV